ncbi:MAG: NADH-quinone oxidoreductase subunit NuoH [Anaerolineae bacterium]|nr:NADH-quinone oxidoreductase subunit NuoH [Anaerolineae bacterium]
MFGPGESSTVIECAGNGTCAAIHAIFTSLVLFGILLTGFAYTTLLERRFLASIQSRIGPNRAGWRGVLQPVADGIKLIFKEDVTPATADKLVFWLAPVIKVVPAILVVAVIPLGPKIAVPWFDGKWYRMSQGLVDVNVGVLWVLGITSIGIYGIVLAGWSSNNKYSMLGGLRSSAQMISYELSMGLTFVVPVMLAGSMSLVDIIEAQNDTPVLGWYVFQNPLSALILMVALLAEVNRAPFDLPEAEQELTAGYHTEYSGMKFALFFMAEYIGMVTVSMIGAALYFGGYHFFFVDDVPILGPLVYAAKVVILLMVMIWVRGTLPRIRYDRLMTLGWKVMLPLSLLAVVWTTVLVLISEEVSDLTYIVLAIVASVVLLLGAAVFFGRVGRKPDMAVGQPRVEVVSLSGGRAGSSALHAVDRVAGLFARRTPAPPETGAGSSGSSEASE